MSLLWQVTMKLKIYIVQRGWDDFLLTYSLPDSQLSKHHTHIRNTLEAIAQAKILVPTCYGGL